jgi:hypothetical protein
MNFFFDRNMPPRLAKMLAIYSPEHAIQHHNDKFSQSTSDIDWIKELCKHESHCAVFTQDAAILRNPNEKAALLASNLTFFFLKQGWLNLNLHEKSWKFLRAWPTIISNADHEGWSFDVSHMDGKCTRLKIPSKEIPHIHAHVKAYSERKSPQI